jgi:hypothetical protein
MRGFRMIKILIFCTTASMLFVFQGCKQTELNSGKKVSIRNDSTAYADSISQIELNRQKATVNESDSSRLKDTARVHK